VVKNEGKPEDLVGEYGPRPELNPLGIGKFREFEDSRRPPSDVVNKMVDR
jgi:hypothetical protein